MVEKILNEFVKYILTKISPPPNDRERPPDFKRYNKVEFPDDIFLPKVIPKFLKRKPNEIYKDYIDRITTFCKDMEIERLNDIMGELNPQDLRLHCAIKFLEKVIEDKKDTCVIF